MFGIMNLLHLVTDKMMKFVSKLSKYKISKVQVAVSGIRVVIELNVFKNTNFYTKNL